jgi:dihydrofolate reductase
MRKIVLTEWITLDGFTSGLNNDMSFVGQHFNAEMGKYESDILNTGDTIILGRVTYESFAGAWPEKETNPNTDPAEREYAKRLNAKKKIVFSKTLEKPQWNNTEIKKEIVADEIKKLKNNQEQIF